MMESAIAAWNRRFPSLPPDLMARVKAWVEAEGWSSPAGVHAKAQRALLSTIRALYEKEKARD